jgi:capsular exopolysaccharide synthesis family protein
LLDYWRVLIARRWTVAAVVLTVLVGTLIWTYSQTPIYRASMSLQIDRENSNLLNFKDPYQLEDSSDDVLRTQHEVLRSRSLAQRVVQELHLQEAPQFQPAPPTLVRQAMSSVSSVLSGLRKKEEVAQDQDQNDIEEQLRPTVDRYLSRLAISPVNRARLVNVTFDSEDPRLASKILNAHAKAFIEQNLEAKYQATVVAQDFLSQQLVQLKGNLERAEDNLQEYGRRNQLLFTEEGRSTATEKLKQLEEEYTKAQAARIQRASFNEMIQSHDVDALPQVLTSDRIKTLSGQLSELRRQDAQLAVTFAPTYPARERIKNQIVELEKDVEIEKGATIKMIQIEYAASIERERQLATALDTQREVVNKTNQEIIQYNILGREVQSNRQLYDGLLTRLKEAGVSASLRASNIRVVDQANAPRIPVSPRHSMHLMIGLLVGLGFGVGLAFFQEYVDDSVKSVEDISRNLMVPSLGVIPKLQSLTSRRGYGYGYRYGYFYGYGRDAEVETVKLPETLDPESQTRITVDLIAHYKPASLMSEAYRTIRTSLLLSSAGRTPKTILVTSAVPSEGKTVTVANTAVSLSQTGARVVLIDGDMRKPRLHKVLEIPNTTGLSAYLAGTANTAEIIQQTSVPNLYCITCGDRPPNPSELLSSSRLTELFAELSQKFDYLLIDSPPLSNVSDGRVIASKCDRTVLVVKAFATSRHQVRRAVDSLMETKAELAGLVLNDLDVRIPNSSYSYSSSYSRRSSGQYR